MIKSMRGRSLRCYNATDQVGRGLGCVILSTTIDILQEELQDLGGTRGIVRLATKTL